MNRTPPTVFTVPKVPDAAVLNGGEHDEARPSYKWQLDELKIAGLDIDL
jgi:hypothetical protein